MGMGSDTEGWAGAGSWAPLGAREPVCRLAVERADTLRHKGVRSKAGLKHT